MRLRISYSILLAMLCAGVGARANPPLTVSPITGLTSAVIPAPTQLLAFSDPKVCSAYGGFAGSLACEAILPKGGIALVWTYPKRPIDGYRAYQVPNPRAHYSAASPARVFQAHAPVATQAARIEDGSVARLIILDPRPAGFEGTCFAVTAFVGERESPLSAPFCIGGGATARNVSLQPAHTLMMRIEYTWNPTEDKIFDPHGETEEARFDPLRHGQSFFIGHARQDMYFRPDRTVSGTNAMVAQGYVYYDLAELSGAKINAAKLHFSTESGNGSVGSCITEIDEPYVNWVATHSALWSHGQRLLVTDSYVGPEFDIDITSIARGWAAGQPNKGLQLVGDAWPGVNYQLKNIADTCVTSFSNVTLEVNYIK